MCIVPGAISIDIDKQNSSIKYILNIKVGESWIKPEP